MAFCSKCGLPLALRSIEGESRMRDACTGCREIYYDNPKILVWCFAHCRMRVLFCRRATEPALGLWAPPAGYVEAGETLEEAAVRETYEETGLQLNAVALVLLKVVSIPHMNQVYVGFRAPLPNEPRLTPGPEVQEARFWSEADFPYSDYAFRSMVKGSPEDFFHALATGDFRADSATVRP